MRFLLSFSILGKLAAAITQLHFYSRCCVDGYYQYVFFFRRVRVLLPGEPTPNPGVVQLSADRFGRRAAKPPLGITDVKKVFFLLFPPLLFMHRDARGRFRGEKKRRGRSPPHPLIPCARGCQPAAGNVTRGLPFRLADKS